MRTTSIVVPDQKKSWLLIAAAIALVLAVATTIALVDIPGERLPSQGDGLSGRSATERELPQAAWEVNVRPYGIDGKLTSAHKKALDRHRPRLRALVTSVYNSMFIDPARLPATLRKHFSEPAARALRRTAPGPSEAGRVSTRLRRAHIGLHPAGGARMAVASVTVRAVPEGATRPVFHRSALWLERAQTGWKVVAFELKQGPMRERTGSPEKKRDDTVSPRKKTSADNKGRGKNG